MGGKAANPTYSAFEENLRGEMPKDGFAFSDLCLYIIDWSLSTNG
jgi:hypothetical protein